MLILFFLMLSCNKDINKDSYNSIDSKDFRAIIEKPILENELVTKIDTLSKSKRLKSYYDTNGCNILMVIIINDLSLEEKKRLLFLTIYNILKEKNFKIVKNYDEVEKIIKEKSGREYQYIKDFCDRRDVKGKSLIFYVFDKNEEYFIDLFINMVDLETMDCNGIKPLTYIIKERSNVISYLYRKKYLSKFNLNYNYKIVTKIKDPLIFAVLKGDKEAVKILLKAGCCSDSIDEKGNKAILIAANRGDYDIVDILLASGAKCLTKEKILSRKMGIGITKAASLFVQLGSSIGPKAAGIPVAPTISNLDSLILDETNLDRPSLYSRIFQRFLEGKWLDFENKNCRNISRYKNYFKGISYYLGSISNEEAINKFKKFNKGKSKILSLIVSGRAKIERKLLESKTFAKRLESLEKDFKKLDNDYIEEDKIQIYKNIQDTLFGVEENISLKNKVIALKEKIKTEKNIFKKIKLIKAMQKKDKTNDIEEIKKLKIFIYDVKNDIDYLENNLKKTYEEIQVLKNMIK